MSEKALAIMASIISVAALFIAYNQVEMTREHNYLSVKPQITFHSHLSELTGRPIGLSIKNTGIGPAIIKNYKIMPSNQDPVEGRQKIDVEEKTPINTKLLDSFLKSSYIEIKYESMYQNETFTETWNRR